MTDEPGAWEPWSFEERRRLARYVSDEAEDSFPVADKLSWRIESGLDRLEAIQKVYEGLAGRPEGQRLFYALEEYHPAADRQPVRSPRKILEARRGTCLDLTLLFCGLCLPLRLCPVVVVARDHAYALVALKRSVGGTLALDEEPLRNGAVTDLELLQRLVEEGRYLALECTGFAALEEAGNSRAPLTFEAALEAGRKNLSGRGLRFALDVASARYIQGELSLPERAGEPPWPLLRRRWVQWEEGRRDEVRFREQLETHVRDSRVLDQFEKFLMGAVWHKKIEYLVNRIARATTPDQGVRKLQGRLRDVVLTASYPEVLADLKEALAHPGPRVVHNRIGVLERETGLSHRAIPLDRKHEPEVQELERLREAREALLDLQEEVREPRHGRCLLLLGEPGSGKTHLAVRFQPDIAAPVPPKGGDWIPSPDEEWRSLVLWLRPEDDGGTLREKIEKLIQRITGHPWKSLEHFQGYLRRAETGLKTRNPQMSYGLPRLVLVLDGLDSWLRYGRVRLEEVENLVLETSKLHSIYWVFTLLHTAFPEVARRRDLWSAYAWTYDGDSEQGAVRALRQIGAWIDLDRLNQLELLGIEIVQDVFAAEEATIRLRIDSGTPAERDLSNPQNAWTLAHCRHDLDLDLDYLVNLNFIEYVERFWERREKRIDSPDSSIAGKPSALVSAAVRVMTEGLGFNPPRAALVSAVALSEKDRSGFQDPALVERGIQLLENAGLWQAVEGQDEKGPLVRLELRNQFFWALRIAQHLAGRLRSRDTWNLATLLPEGTDPYLQEGAIEFLLLLMSQGEDAEAAGRLWEQALLLPGPARASAWIGAAKAEPDFQQRVAGASRQVRPQGDREIFSFLYFVGEAAPEVLSPTERMKMLHPYFPKIAAAGQVDYFLHVLAKTLEQVESRDEWLGVLSYLDGVEVLGETRALAGSVADAALRVCEGRLETVLGLLIDYARQESRRLEWSKDPPPPPHAERDEGKYYLREWVLFATLAMAADYHEPNGPADLFPILWRTSWYDPRRLEVTVDPVWFNMEAQANTVLGYQYRRSNGDDKKAYEALVSKLAHSEKGYERKLAFFLIRHSVATGGKRGVRVHDAFHHILANLFLDRDEKVQKSVQKFYEDFRANLQGGHDFAELEGRRRDLLKELKLSFPDQRR